MTVGVYDEVIGFHHAQHRAWHRREVGDERDEQAKGNLPCNEWDDTPCDGSFNGWWEDDDDRIVFFDFIDGDFNIRCPVCDSCYCKFCEENLHEHAKCSQV